jgi:hypothetical protein
VREQCRRSVSRLLLAQSTANVALDLVTLFRALGGGWEQTLPDPPKPMVVQVKQTVTADPAPR